MSAVARSSGCEVIRRRSAQGKQQATQQQLRVDIGSLDEEEQAQRDDGVAHNGDLGDADTVADHAPERAADEGDQLISEAQGADGIADAMVAADAIGDDEGEGAVEEDQEGDAEQGDAEQVGGDLPARGCEGEHQDEGLGSVQPHGRLRGCEVVGGDAGARWQGGLVLGAWCLVLACGHDGRLAGL